MLRCLELAREGAGTVSPNPLVGAVLVYGNRIIGEGWHQLYGQPHAEVNCFASVHEVDKPFIPYSTLYVSLEPCAHYGKTPPCSDLIIQKKVPEVVIGSLDPFPQVNGSGVEKLISAGVKVTKGILEKECQEINRRFFTFYQKHRPYIILKWAQTEDGFLASISNEERLYISNEISNRLVHRWRSEEDAILVGTSTANLDDPSLTNRLWSGKSPVRMVIDMDLKLDPALKLFDRSAPTIIFNAHRNSFDHTIMAGRSTQFVDQLPLYCQVKKDMSLVPQIVHALHQMKVQSVIIEGGARIIQSFINENCWDEARIITNKSFKIGSGLPAPQLSQSIKVDEQLFGTDQVTCYRAVQDEA
jgi:diaminohydroxyphosphoribosylaminopyrimidine deaminase/5-amino-6-(5-phosphoribosylamino)uracil reductase